MTGNPVELLQTSLGQTPEAFDAIDVVTATAIDVVTATGELVSPMINPKMFSITNIDQTIVAAPAVAVNDYLKSQSPTNNGLQTGFGAVGHNLGVDPSMALEQPKGRWSSPKTGVLPAAPRPFLPRTRLAPK